MADGGRLEAQCSLSDIRHSAVCFPVDALHLRIIVAEIDGT